MEASLISEINQRLETDNNFKFKTRTASKLSGGKCPECNEPEAYVFKDKPFVIHCPRPKCGESKTHIKNLAGYEDLFTNYGDRYPPTESDPELTARMYMRYGRGFKKEVVDGLYKQGALPIYRDGKLVKHAHTVKFELLGKYSWERIIDEADVRLAGRKNQITKGANFTGLGWMPPKQKIDGESYVFITEGILKSIALMHLDLSFDLATIAAISSSNFPRKIVEENKDQGVTWVLAYDGDFAGIKASIKFKAELEEMGERYLVCLPPYGKDWDDLLKEEKLNEQSIKDGFYRGALSTTATPKEKLFWLFAKTPTLDTFRFEHNNSLWRAKKDEQRAKEAELSSHSLTLNECWCLPGEDLEDEKESVKSSFSFERISNCYPKFLYLERDAIHGDQFYFFKIKYASGNPDTLVALEGTALQSPTGFSSFLLNKSSGGSFDGNPYDLKSFRDEWFNWGICEVKSFPFVGYDKASGIYILPYGGFHKNRFIEINKDGYIESGKHKVKTSSKSVHLTHLDKFNPEIFKDFMASFSINGLMFLSWWLGSLFAEQVRGAQKSWPFFELTGDQGAGKSTLIEFCWCLLGRDNYEGFDPGKATNVGRARSLAQVSNMPVMLIEGDRNGEGDFKRKGTFDLDELKTAYDGRPVRAVGVAKRGSDTEELPFRGAVGIAQNATVSGSEALLSRIVHAHCNRSHHSEKSELAINALHQAKNEGVSGFLHVVLSQSDTLFDLYLEKFKGVLAEFKKELPGVQNRLVLNHAQIYSWALCLPKIFGTHITKAHLTQLKEHILSRASDRQERLKADHPMVAKFWDIYEAQNELPDRNGDHPDNHCLFNHSTKPDAYIAINLVDFETKAGKRLLGRDLDYNQLKNLLPMSQRYPFIAKKNAKSKLDGSTKFCWVFKNTDDLLKVEGG